MPSKRKAQKKAAPAPTSAAKRLRAEELEEAQASPTKPQVEMQTEESDSWTVDEASEVKEVRSGKARDPKRGGTASKVNKVKVEEEPRPNGGASSATEEGRDEEDSDCRFLGDPIPEEEARTRWPKRYEGVCLMFSLLSFQGSISVVCGFFEILRRSKCLVFMWHGLIS